MALLQHKLRLVLSARTSLQGPGDLIAIAENDAIQIVCELAAVNAAGEKVARRKAVASLESRRDRATIGEGVLNVNILPILLFSVGLNIPVPDWNTMIAEVLKHLRDVVITLDSDDETVAVVEPLERPRMDQLLLRQRWFGLLKPEQYQKMSPEDLVDIILQRDETIRTMKVFSL
jgi:hypothetical protein